MLNGGIARKNGDKGQRDDVDLLFDECACLYLKAACVLWYLSSCQLAVLSTSRISPLLVPLLVS